MFLNFDIKKDEKKNQIVSIVKLNGLVRVLQLKYFALYDRSNL